MTQLRTLSLALCSTLAGVTPITALAEEQKEGFIEGSTLTVLNRNFYMNRDHRNGESSPTGNGYSEAWAQGIIGRFQSGFTQGTFGVGVDAFAMIGIKLDTGMAETVGAALSMYCRSMSKATPGTSTPKSAAR